MSLRQIVISHSNQECLGRASEHLERLLGDSEVVVLARTRGSADDFVRACCQSRQALFGIHRMTLTQLAASLATEQLARREFAAVTNLGTEALAARSVHACRSANELDYFEPVADTPGFPRALASTLIELRRENTKRESLAAAGRPGQDLGCLLARYEQELQACSLADYALMCGLATEVAIRSTHRLLGLPLVLLDVAVDSDSELALLKAVVNRAASVFATALASDEESVARLEEVLSVRAELQDGTAEDNSLRHLRRSVFSLSAAPQSNVDRSVEFFSASGEGLECVEIARRICRAAQGGVGFDQMAILLRHPDSYFPLVEDALRRAGVPAYFTRGTIRPDPSGRAFLALLACATEGLSASKFAEYLSLGQVPVVDESGAPPGLVELWAPPEDEIQSSFKFPPPEVQEPPLASGLPRPPFETAAGLGLGEARSASLEATAEAGAEFETDELPLIEGTLRAPFGWEKLLIDASVIGGKERWSRRLRGLEAEYRLQLEALQGEADSLREFVEKQLERLSHLQRFALPVIEFLSALPSRTRWREWLDALTSLAGMTLRRPDSVLSVLGELRPMEEVGPVTLTEVDQVLSERLSFLRREPPARRYGKVFVGAIDEAGARSFEIVFLPGLAEGVFPRRPSEDPLLLDEHRACVNSALKTRSQRAARERLLLRRGAAAARSQLCVSYPRMDVEQARPRVPSVFALEVLRGAEGRLPALRDIERRAGEASQSRLGWPAPRETRDAIDDAEYDLALLEPLLHRPPQEVKGHGAYLMEASPCLARSLRTRWARWEKHWSEADGIFRPDAATLRVLAAHAMNARSYSPSALEHYTKCPYRFLLHAIHRLKEREEAVAIERLDPLTRGALFHEVQFRFFRALVKDGPLPIQDENFGRAMDTADQVFGQVAAEYEEKLAPAIPPIWKSELEDLRTDLRGWIRKLIPIHADWLPVHFEYAFGLRPEPGREAEQDPESIRGEAVILDGVRLRGRIDLLEKHRQSGLLRVTDHKTGRAPQPPPLFVGKGEVLQPLLYALAAEKLLGQPAKSGVLSYCTQRGNYTEVEVPANAEGRMRIAQVIKTIGGAIQEGTLPAAPRKDACKACDYRMVCGPHEERRVQGKRDRLDALEDLRCLP